MPKRRKRLKTIANAFLVIWVLTRICEMPGGLTMLTVVVATIGLSMGALFVSLLAAGAWKSQG